MHHQTSRPRRAVFGAVLAVALLATSAACTGEDDPGAGASPSPLPSRSVESQPTVAAKPVPMEVSMGKVIGKRLRPAQRRRIETQVGRVVERYFDEAFVGGDYPRRDFSDSFAAFTDGAARRARADRDLLTNVGSGEQVETVVPRRKLARLDALVSRRKLVGLTARVRLVFVEERADAADRRVRVSGRFLMSRKRSGAWQVFGYDVSRSATALSGRER